MRAVLILAFLVVVSAQFAAAQDVCKTNQPQDGDSVYDPNAWNTANSICSNAGSACDIASLSKLPQPLSPSNQNKYLRCLNSPCCVDDCYARYSSACLESPQCFLVPGPGQQTQCTSKSKVCALINVTDCTKYNFCQESNGLCAFKLPQTPPPVQGESVSAKCPALHPIVIAMLVLMFLSFVAGVVVVAVVVIRNQKKADEEDRRREQAEAAAAEAKRARQNRNTRL